jgi:phage gpG-like protein
LKLSITNSLAGQLNRSAALFNNSKDNAAGKVAGVLQTHFSNSFADEGFTDESLQQWQQVKRRLPGTPEYKYPKFHDLDRRTRKILVGKGTPVLSQSVQVMSASFTNGITVGTTVPYAAYHNTGTDKLPKREFIGDSKQMMTKVGNVFDKWLNEIFRY